MVKCYIATCMAFTPIALCALPWVGEVERESALPKQIHKIVCLENAPGKNPEKIYTNETGFVGINYDDSKAGVLGRDYSIPDPLVFADGRKVSSAEDWSARRKEMLGIFEREVYGRMPSRPDAVPFEIVSEKTTEDRFAAVSTLPKESSRLTQTAVSS